MGDSNPYSKRWVKYFKEGAQGLSMSANNISKSYEKHSEHDAKIVAIDEKPSEYTRPDSVDAWRHRKMLDTLILQSRQARQGVNRW